MSDHRVLAYACAFGTIMPCGVQADLLPLDVYGRVGDLIRVDLKAARGGSSFSLGANDLFGDAQILTSDELEGLPFSDTGRLYLVPGIEAAPATSLDAPGDRGFRGTLDIPVTIDGEALDLSVTVRDGYTYQSTSDTAPLTVGTDDSLVSVAAAQQRLNYLGYQKVGGGSLVVDGILGSNTESALRLFRASIDGSGEVNPGSVSGNLNSTTVRMLNSHQAPHWLELVDPDPQTPRDSGRPGSSPIYDFDASNIEGNFDILPTRDPGTGVHTGRTPQSERYATSWTIQTILNTSQAMPGRLINAMSRIDGVGSSAAHSTHQAGLDIDVHIDPSVWNYGDGALSAAELDVVEMMMAFYSHTPDEARVWRIIVSNTDIRDEFNRQVGASIAIGDSSGVHLNHLHIDLQETLSPRDPLPSMLTGDFNLDDTLDVEDLDLLMANLAWDAFYFDLNNDDAVDLDDFDRLTGTYLNIRPGDANYDQRVDLLDLSILASHFNTANGLWSGGDFNADGVTDLLDLSALASQFGSGTVPEPTTAFSVILGLGLASRRR